MAAVEDAEDADAKPDPDAAADADVDADPDADVATALALSEDTVGAGSVTANGAAITGDLMMRLRGTDGGGGRSEYCRTPLSSIQINCAKAI